MKILYVFGVSVAVCAGVSVLKQKASPLRGLEPAYEAPPCRFALKYNTEDLAAGNADVIDSFLDEYVRGEAQFIRTAGTDPKGGWTLDGQRLDVTTGTPCEIPHVWTASSKESMQIAMFARILWDYKIHGDPKILSNRVMNWKEVLDVLNLKMVAYKQFTETYPGFGGWFPWMKVNLTNGVAGPDEPAWKNHEPALDNAELFWPLWTLVQVMKDGWPNDSKFRDVIDYFDGHVSKMLASARPIFYNASKPGIRTDTFMTDQTKPVEENSYSQCDINNNCINNYLDDPYEGELFLDMLTAFPEETGFSTAELDALWDGNKAKTIKRSTTIGETLFEAEQGWVYSSHEKWKYLFLPYTRSENNKRTFMQGERVRTNFGAQPGMVGLWGAVTGTMTDNTMDPGYHPTVGIKELALNDQGTFENWLVTPYGSYPVILANQSVGLAWLHNLMKAKKGQNCFGTTEGFDISGKSVSSIVTWDTKITTLLSVFGGIADIAGNYLDLEGKMDPLVQRWESMWADMVSDGFAGETADFALPHDSIPTDFIDDYTTCTDSMEVCSASDYTLPPTDLGTTTATPTSAATPTIAAVATIFMASLSLL